MNRMTGMCVCVCVITVLYPPAMCSTWRGGEGLCASVTQTAFAAGRHCRCCHHHPHRSPLFTFILVCYDLALQVVHRDIEPKHLGLDSKGHLGLLDLGCAVLLHLPASGAPSSSGTTRYSGVCGCSDFKLCVGGLQW